MGPVRGVGLRGQRRHVAAEEAVGGRKQHGRSMMRTSFLAILFVAATATVQADPMTCNLSGYKAAAGLTAACDAQAVTVTWTGDKSQELRLRLTIDGGTPTIDEI